MLFGVCGGLGRYLGIDPALVRVVFVLLVILGASGVLLYLIGLVAMPSAEPGSEPGAAPSTLSSSPAVLVGAVLVGAGSLLLASRVVPGFGQLLGPLLLITVGVAVIVAGRR